MSHFSILFLRHTHTVNILQLCHSLNGILAKFRREVNPDMPEQLYINNLCDTNRNLSFYKEYVHERSEILCGLSVTCINLFNGIILLLACCLDCKPLGWWLVNYLSVTVAASNIVGVVFFWLKITLEGSLSLCILNEKLAGHLGKGCSTTLSKTLSQTSSADRQDTGSVDIT